jgi:serine/threonine protein kinase
MPVYRGISGKTYTTDALPFAGGGEGDIYAISGNSGQAAKIYKPEKRSTETERKLSVMVDLKPDIIEQYAWPLDVLYEDDGFAGFIMPRVHGKEKLRNIYVYDKRDKSWTLYLAIAKNLAAAVYNVHEINQVIGDLNPENILVDRRTGLVTLVDTDSYHISDRAGNVYRCGVGMPEFVAPELQGIHFPSEPLPTFTKETDEFALSGLMFALLMNGAHPFACKTVSGSSSKFQPIDNLVSGICAYFPESGRDGVEIPKYAPPLNTLPLEIQGLFHRSFVEGHRKAYMRPSAEEWFRVFERLVETITVCGKNSSHQYYRYAPECPWCAVEEKMANPPQRSPSPIKQAEYASSAPESQNPVQYFYNIGDYGPAGGLVFYDKGSYSGGWRYLETAPPESQFNAPWGPAGEVGGTYTSVGCGRQNTVIIMTKFSQWGVSGTAAQLCASLDVSGYTDWFLPSLEELELIYQNLNLKGLGGFNKYGWYWSSSEDTKYDGLNKSFNDEVHIYDGFKMKVGLVRAVRAF